jgi:hypothetical protein
MHFDMKNILKSNRNHILKHYLYVTSLLGFWSIYSLQSQRN